MHIVSLAAQRAVGARAQAVEQGVVLVAVEGADVDQHVAEAERRGAAQRLVDVGDAPRRGRRRDIRR